MSFYFRLLKKLTVCMDFFEKMGGYWFDPRDGRWEFGRTRRALFTGPCGNGAEADSGESGNFGFERPDGIPAFPEMADLHRWNSFGVPPFGGSVGAERRCRLKAGLQTWGDSAGEAR